MELANQYGINLPAIDQAVSAKKTAEQNVLANKQAYDFNALKMDSFKRTEAEDVEDRAKKLDLETQAKNAENLARHAIVISKLPDAQKVSATKQILSQLPPEAQAKIYQDYAINPNDDNSILQALPHMTMATLKTADILKRQFEQQDAETKQQNVLAEEGVKHANKMDQINALYGNKKEIAGKTNETKIKVAEIGAKGRQKLAEYKANHGTSSSKPTVLEMKAAALVDGGEAKNINEAIRMVMRSTSVTNVNDPVMGNKTITSNKSYGNALRPPPPLAKKKLPPLDVNKYTR